MAEIDDRHLMTDENLLDHMEAAAARRLHPIFDQLEDFLWQRYVRFDLETFPIPFDRKAMVEQFFPEEIQARYWELRGRIYPDLRDRPTNSS